MTLDEIIPHLQNIKDIDLAKQIIELELNPNGYFGTIYNNVMEKMNNNVPEKDLIKIFKEFEENSGLKYFQYITSLYDEIKESKIQTLINKTTFFDAVYSIKDIYTLKLYLI